MHTDFDKQSYWDNRFTTETSFEWLISSPIFMSILEAYLVNLHPTTSCTSTAKILHIGFGTSDLQTHLRARGFTSVLNIDFSPLAIDHGKALEKRVFGDVLMRYEVMDATKLGDAPLLDTGNEEEKGEGEGEGGGEGGKFDLVVDKSTVDAISCGGDEELMKMVEGVRRILKRRGVWISLSYSERRFELNRVRELFDVEVLERIPTIKRREMDPDVFYWCYLLRPRE